MITPPSYSPAALTTSKVVAVPKSTAMLGPPSCSNAATALTILSAPSSRGLSIRIGMPVLSPGPTDSVRWPRYRSPTATHSGSSWGTVDETIEAASKAGGLAKQTLGSVIADCLRLDLLEGEDDPLGDLKTLRAQLAHGLAQLDESTDGLKKRSKRA